MAAEGEVQREIKTEIWVHTLSYTHTHTHSSRFIQQNPLKEPMTAATEAANKKNILNYETTPYCFEKYNNKVACTWTKKKTTRNLMLGFVNSKYKSDIIIII